MQVVGESEPYELIEQQLVKIKCKQCNKEYANYFVFNNGFFCTLCFSKLKQVEAVQLLEFAQILNKSIDDYKKHNASSTSAPKVIGGQINKKYEALKAKRDSLNVDLSTQKSKTIQKINFLNQACEQANINEPLEELYEPSLRVSSNMSITDILQKNLQNLRLKQQNDQTIYEFTEKDTKSTNEIVNSKLDLIKTSIDNLKAQCNDVVDEYYKQLQKLKK